MNVLPIFEASASPTVIKVPPRTLRGVSLAHILTKKSSIERALLGADLHAGRTVLTRATLRQSALLTGASVGAVFAAGKLSPRERQLAREGARPLVLHEPATARDDAAVIVDIVNRVGADRVLEMVIATGVMAA